MRHRRSNPYLVICTIFVGQVKALLTEVLLHQRVDDNLFTNGVASDFPYKLVCPALLSRLVARSLLVVIVIFVHLFVVLRDSVKERVG